MGEVYDDTATVPAVSSSTTITFYDNPVIGATAIFREGDKGFIRISDSTNGGLNYALVWGTVTSYSDNADGSQDWTFTTGSLGAAVGGDTIPQGSVFISWGQPGMGVWHVTTNDLGIGPYAGIQTWAGSDPWTAANRTTRIRLGDLQGVGHQGYGLFAGMAGTAGPRIIISDSVAEFHGIPISMYHGTPDTDGNVRIYAIEIDTESESNVYPNADITAGPVGEALVRSTGAGTWESHIDNSPDTPGTDYLRLVVNRGLNYAAFDLGDLTESSGPYMIRAYFMNKNLVDDYVSIRMRLYDATYGYGWLTDEVTMWTSDMAANDVGTIVERELTNPVTADGPTWAAAQLYIYATYITAGGTEVMRIEPGSVLAGQGPYLAIGDPPPDDYWTGETGEGIWLGRTSSDTYTFRVGGGGSNTTRPAITYGPTSGLQFWASDDKTNPTIQLDSSGNAYIKNTLELNSATGQIVADEVTLSSSGVNINAYSGGASWFSANGYTFTRSGTVFGGIYGAYSTGSLHAVSIQSSSVAGYNSVAYFQSHAASGQTATTFIGTNYLTGTARAEIECLSSSSNSYIIFRYADYADFQMPIYSRSLDIDQEGDSTYAISLSDSTDITGMTTEGMDTADQYGKLSKQVDGTGALLIQGGGEATVGTFMIGSAATGTSTHSTSATAPLMLSGRNANAAPAAGNNAIVWKAGTTTRLIMETDGQLWSNYATTLSTYGDEDDDALLRQLELMIINGTSLTESFDGWVEEHRIRLEALGIWENGFINLHKLNMLKIGALTDHGRKLVELTQRVREQDSIIRLLASKLGLDTNSGTILEN